MYDTEQPITLCYDFLLGLPQQIHSLQILYGLVSSQRALEIKRVSPLYLAQNNGYNNYLLINERADVNYQALDTSDAALYIEIWAKDFVEFTTHQKGKKYWTLLRLIDEKTQQYINGMLRLPLYSDTDLDLQSFLVQHKRCFVLPGFSFYVRAGQSSEVVMPVYGHELYHIPHFHFQEVSTQSNDRLKKDIQSMLQSKKSVPTVQNEQKSQQQVEEAPDSAIRERSLVSSYQLDDSRNVMIVLNRLDGIQYKYESLLVQLLVQNEKASKQEEKVILSDEKVVRIESWQEDGTVKLNRQDGSFSLDLSEVQLRNKVDKIEDLQSIKARITISKAKVQFGETEFTLFDERSNKLKQGNYRKLLLIDSDVVNIKEAVKVYYQILTHEQKGEDSQIAFLRNMIPSAVSQRISNKNIQKQSQPQRQSTVSIQQSQKEQNSQRKDLDQLQVRLVALHNITSKFLVTAERLVISWAFVTSEGILETSTGTKLRYFSDLSAALTEHEGVVTINQLFTIDGISIKNLVELLQKKNLNLSELQVIFKIFQKPNDQMTGSKQMQLSFEKSECLAWFSHKLYPNSQKKPLLGHYLRALQPQKDFEDSSYAAIAQQANLTFSMLLEALEFEIFEEGRLEVPAQLAEPNPENTYYQVYFKKISWKKMPQSIEQLGFKIVLFKEDKPCSTIRGYQHVYASNKMYDISALGNETKSIDILERVLIGQTWSSILRQHASALDRLILFIQLEEVNQAFASATKRIYLGEFKTGIQSLEFSFKSDMPDAQNVVAELELIPYVAKYNQMQSSSQ